MHPATPVLHRPGFAKGAARNPDAVLADPEQVLDARVAALTVRRPPGRGLAGPEQGSKAAAGRGRRGPRSHFGKKLVQTLLDFFRRGLGSAAFDRRLGPRHRPVHSGEKFGVFFGRGRGSGTFHVRYHNTSTTPRQTRERFSRFLPF